MQPPLAQPPPLPLTPPLPQPPKPSQPPLEPGRPAAAAGPAPPQHKANWALRLVLAALALIGLGACYLVAVVLLPRWWAERVGQVAGGHFTNGVAIGFVVGAGFTVLAMLVLRAVFRRGRSWRTRTTLIVLALLLCVPNLLTLGIVLGNDDAAREATATLDAQAEGFRGASLVGAIAGAVVVVFLGALLASRRKRKTQVAALKAQIAERDADAARPPTPTPNPLGPGAA